MVFKQMWFTSDLHFWHKKANEHNNRPWTTVEDMNEGLIENWNSVVGDDDLVVILGDMFFCGTQKAQAIMKRLKGAKHLVLGNHDWKVVKEHRAADFGFHRVTKGIETGWINGAPVVMCHFPYRGDHTPEERYSEHRPKDQGLWLLHGHVHTLWKIKDRQINVGCDVWDWKPVNADEIAKIIRDAQPKASLEFDGYHSKSEMRRMEIMKNARNKV